MTVTSLSPTTTRCSPTPPPSHPLVALIPDSLGSSDERVATRRAAGYETVNADADGAGQVGRSVRTRLAVLAAPVLNRFWPTSAGAAGALAESVEMLRVVVMHRLAHVRAARTEAAGCDTTRP
ncbi:hypothetical protein GCM10022255_101720 [Dactylosporangium darangshiense]|uniref:Uncharacterized protein n=1 Tax=Dactylosporangium darangshiense TaxID=579108 RepID=A0ABP8DS21_9ACTN